MRQKDEVNITKYRIVIRGLSGFLCIIVLPTLTFNDALIVANAVMDKIQETRPEFEVVLDKVAKENPQ
jgi:hypothetical protein